MSEQEQITALANAYGSLVDELRVKGLIDANRVEHNSRELSTMPAPLQRLK